jgi:hypothetical protein
VEKCMYDFYIKVGIASGKENVCDGKKQFTSESYARKVALKSTLLYKAQMVHYPCCVFCGNWHVGHKMPFSKMLILEKRGEEFLKQYRLKPKTS